MQTLMNNVFPKSSQNIHELNNKLKISTRVTRHERRTMSQISNAMKYANLYKISKSVKLMTIEWTPGSDDIFTFAIIKTLVNQ